MLNNFDCIVQAPTGSGKTLAYILPLLEILHKNKEKVLIKIILNLIIKIFF
jgi:superfamily II DNA/RNA helicase